MSLHLAEVPPEVTASELDGLEERVRSVKATVKGFMNHAGKVTRELAEFAADLDQLLESTAQQEAQDDHRTADRS